MRNIAPISFGLSAAIPMSLVFAAYAQNSFSSSSARVDKNCVMAVQDSSVSAEVCEIPSGDRIVRLTLQRTKAPLIYEAQFGPAATEQQFPKAGVFWHRFAVASGDGVITLQEQQTLRVAVLAKGPQNLAPTVRSVIDFVANFVEPGVALEPYDVATSNRPHGFGNLRGLGSGFTMICDSIGYSKEAVFTARGTTNVVLTPVGQEDTRCRGRCGFGCEQPFQWRSNQYTQECLNHDACRDLTDGLFGDCKDEFWAAAEGYVAAPDCPTHAVPGPITPVPPVVPAP